ncbi:hypothetical protein F4810DRAFT_672073 [Camillea tinctor]|nr:hypothetical protein F4810DRAFT_672073 [Camillea tinctor]
MGEGGRRGREFLMAMIPNLVVYNVLLTSTCFPCRYFSISFFLAPPFIVLVGKTLVYTSYISCSNGCLFGSL